MTHDELLDAINHQIVIAPPFASGGYTRFLQALGAVVELHKPDKIPDWVPTEEKNICWCAHIYPCPTIQAIEKELG